MQKKIKFQTTLQWGRNFFVTEIRGYARCYTTGSGGFNGAVTFSLRKLPAGDAVVGILREASMGP